MANAYVNDDCEPLICPSDICFIECEVEKAFCGMSDQQNVFYLEFNQPDTNVGQDANAILYGETCAPIYISPLLLPAVWDINNAKENIKAHGTEIKPDATMTLNLMVLNKMNISLKMTDRIRIKDKDYEIRELDENYGMAQLRVDIKLKLYLVH